MIHFFPTFSNDARRSPFAQELTAQGVPHRLFSGEVILRYRRRIWLLMWGWPKMTAFALKSAIHSLILSHPHPTTVVIGSHIEVIVFGLFRTLLLRKNLEIVWLGFIYTKRKSMLINRMRKLYFGFIFSIVDKAICHSSLEVKRYSSLFKNSRTRFIYIPYGMHIAGREDLMAAKKTNSGKQPYVLAAGRSGRDYATLFKAIESLDVDLHVVCDSENPIAGLPIPSNVSILRRCYGGSYLDELNNSLFVVIPLAVNDISAGQMVLIQAMAFAKATIITRTASVEEYVADGEQSLLVSQASVTELRDAIEKLLIDRNLATKLGANAIASFEKSYCMKAFVRNLAACLLSPSCIARP